MSNYNVEISADNTITIGLPSTGNGVAGPRGEKGYSAYEVAIKNGYTGTEAEWLATLKGEKGEKGEPGVNGIDGKPGKDGVDGVNGADGKPGTNGLSAYELAAKNGFSGNESAWLASLKGDKGDQGPKGDKGQNGVNGADGKDGLSAYAIAVKNGYNGTEADWVNKWLRGTIVSASTDSDGNMLLTDINGNIITTPLKPLAEAATSAKEAATSAGNAKTSEQNASASAAASAVSATDSANSAKEAATSAANAAESANIATSAQVNADWNVTDSTSKAFIKNKPQVIDEQGVTTIAQRITDAGLDDVMVYMANGITTKALTVYEESSVPTANAGNSSKAIANTEFVAKSIAALVNGAPDQLNTLNELAKALGNDSNFAATVTAELAKKLNSTEAESTYAKKGESGVLPGTVTAFSGTFKDGYPVNKNTGLVDKEWHLCDGTNGTPDLRNRFIYGGDGTNNGATGGETSHTLTEPELPVFTPSIRTSMDESRPNSNSLWHHDRDKVAAGSDSPIMSSAPLASIGGNQPHNNMPPYYVLAFMMKL